MPPSEFIFEDEFDVRIPIYEISDGYPRYINMVVEMLADMYELDPAQLQQALSKSPKEMRKEIKLQQEDLSLKKELLALAS